MPCVAATSGPRLAAMSSSVVRPGFGPTLPEVLADQPRWVQLLARGAGVLLVACVLWWVLLGRASDVTRVVMSDPPAFNIGYAAPFVRVAPHPGERLRLEGAGQEFVVRPLRLPAYRGLFSGFLPAYATVVGQRMQRTRPGLAIRGEGRVNINRVQGYELLYQAPGAKGQRRYGRRIMLLPTDTAREGVELLLEADASPAVVNPESTGRTRPLKTALRSFRFGTETP